MFTTEREMKIAFGIVALAGLASVASAQLVTAGPSSTGGVGFSERSTYSLDDGTAENSVGLSGGGTIAGINFFAVSGGDNVITSVEVAWGSPAFPNAAPPLIGLPFNYHVWANVGPDTNPSGPNAVLLFSGSSTIDPLNVANNTFQSLAVPSIAIPGASFFVGVDLAHPARSFPIAVDQTAPIAGRSWAGGGTSFNPNSIGLGAGGASDIVGFGNWMIRASAVPTPGALALLGLGGIAAGRRRR
jgi:MYXO-CTERM domain-containing protein